MQISNSQEKKVNDGLPIVECPKRLLIVNIYNLNCLVNLSVNDQVNTLDN